MGFGPFFMAEISKFTALATARCPRCRNGKMFTNGVYNLSHMTRMNEVCPHCALRFEVEVGFYWAAMYISYGLNIAIAFIVGLLTSLLFEDPSAWVYVSTIIGAIIIFFPFNYRYSRVLLIYFFSKVGYDKKYSA